METLYSPEPLSLPRMVAIISKGKDVSIFDPILNVNISKHVTISYFNNFTVREDGTVATDIDFTTTMKSVTADEIKMFYQFQQIMQNCITSAETINRKLYGILKNIDNKNNMKSDISQLDFMKLRDRLSDILNTEKKIDSIYELSSKSNVKKFTKSFFRYITDRNIYTHGELSIDAVNNRFLIFAKVDGKEEYYVVDRIILQSHLNYYSYISKLLNEVSNYYLNVKK